MTNASDIMTKNIVAARASTTAREIGTKLVIGNFKWYNSIVVMVSSDF